MEELNDCDFDANSFVWLRDFGDDCSYLHGGTQAPEGAQDEIANCAVMPSWPATQPWC